MMCAIQGNMIFTSVYQSAVVTGLAMVFSKVTKAVMKNTMPPKLDFDRNDIDMMVLDIGVAVYTEDMLIKDGIKPAEIAKYWYRYLV